MIFWQLGGALCGFVVFLLMLGVLGAVLIRLYKGFKGLM